MTGASLHSSFHPSPWATGSFYHYLILKVQNPEEPDMYVWVSKINLLKIPLAVSDKTRTQLYTMETCDAKASLSNS